MPKQLEPGILYVSKEFHTAAHLCACGCGSKVRTPLKPTEWTLTGSVQRPTLTPSIGNWQLPCKSHYWISKGEIIWSSQWSDSQILEGRNNEKLRRKTYFNRIHRKELSLLERVYKWLIKLFR
ncbi:DUF6527 family protein [Vibrio fluvialis]|uniref:DUF6527 family protein n=1 Tax=Vibrio fluvialis TaxID=676 RepID=UPI003BAFC867